MKLAIVYKSIFGITKKYAAWLAEDTKGDLYTFSQTSDNILDKYDTIIVASGTYASWMPLTAFLKNKWPILKDKKVVVLSIGISPPNDPYTQKTLERIPSEIKNSIKIIRLPGVMFGKTPPETGEIKKENINQVLEMLKE